MAAPLTKRQWVTRIYLPAFSCCILGFGGVLPLAWRMMVEERGWLTAGWRPA